MENLDRHIPANVPVVALQDDPDSPRADFPEDAVFSAKRHGGNFGLPGPVGRPPVHLGGGIAEGDARSDSLLLQGIANRRAAQWARWRTIWSNGRAGHVIRMVCGLENPSGFFIISHDRSFPQVSKVSRDGFFSIL